MVQQVQGCLQELLDLIQIQKVLLELLDTTPTDTLPADLDMTQNCILDTTRKLYKALVCVTGDLTLTLKS